MMQNFKLHNFNNQKVLIRVDFNIPIKVHGQAYDHTRFIKALPTIKKVLDDGGSAILMSHAGRPQKENKKDLSLRYLVPYLANQFKTTVEFASDCIGTEAQEKASQLQPGQILLLENLRFHAGEEKADANFAQALAQLADVYVNDAFGVAHRAHASITTITPYFQQKFPGLLLQAEVNHANYLLTSPRRPFTAIMGGAKISDKIQTIAALLDKVDYLLIAGGVANTFLKASGGNLGNSLVEENYLDLARDLLAQAKAKGVTVVLPIDVIAADKVSNLANTAIVPSHEIPDGYMALDIALASQKAFADVIALSKTILWTGPVGIFEFARFIGGTQAITAAVTQATRKGGFSFIGGGESASAIGVLRCADQVSYISTGGGALLAYLVNQTLPALEALEC